MTALVDKIQSKRYKTTPFNTLIIFGEGPIKPILTPQELNADQTIRWRQYKSNPIKSREPNFHVLEDPKILRRIGELSPKYAQSFRQKLQENSRFSLKRWGRQNALAAGLALYAGLTRKVLLSGGKTKPKWYDPKNLHSASWPSEAQLMKDAIVRNFGKIYFEKYGKKIEGALILEEKSTNTLENFAYSINKMPRIVSRNIKVGFLTANHHVKRVTLLANLFSIYVKEDAVLSAQTLLRESKLYSQGEKDVLRIVKFLNECGDLKDLNLFEERWIRGLRDPRYLTYWFGYVAEVKHPKVLAKVFATLKEPNWNEAAKEAFTRLKIAIDDYTRENILEIQKNRPEKYKILIEKLRLLKTPEYRKLPPPVVV